MNDIQNPSTQQDSFSSFLSPTTTTTTTTTNSNNTQTAIGANFTQTEFATDTNDDNSVHNLPPTNSHLYISQSEIENIPNEYLSYFTLYESPPSHFESQVVAPVTFESNRSRHFDCSPCKAHTATVPTDSQGYSDEFKFLDETSPELFHNPSITSSNVKAVISSIRSDIGIVSSSSWHKGNNNKQHHNHFSGSYHYSNLLLHRRRGDLAPYFSHPEQIQLDSLEATRKPTSRRRRAKDKIRSIIDRHSYTNTTRVPDPIITPSSQTSFTNNNNNNNNNSSDTNKSSQHSNYNNNSAKISQKSTMSWINDPDKRGIMSVGSEEAPATPGINTTEQKQPQQPVETFPEEARPRIETSSQSVADGNNIVSASFLQQNNMSTTASMLNQAPSSVGFNSLQNTVNNTTINAFENMSSSSRTRERATFGPSRNNTQLTNTTINAAIATAAKATTPTGAVALSSTQEGRGTSTKPPSTTTRAVKPMLLPTTTEALNSLQTLEKVKLATSERIKKWQIETMESMLDKDGNYQYQTLEANSSEFFGKNDPLMTGKPAPSSTATPTTTNTTTNTGPSLQTQSVDSSEEEYEDSSEEELVADEISKATRRKRKEIDMELQKKKAANKKNGLSGDDKARKTIFGRQFNKIKERLKTVADRVKSAGNSSTTSIKLSLRPSIYGNGRHTSFEARVEFHRKYPELNPFTRYDPAYDRDSDEEKEEEDDEEEQAEGGRKERKGEKNIASSSRANNHGSEKMNNNNNNNQVSTNSNNVGNNSYKDSITATKMKKKSIINNDDDTTNELTKTSINDENINNINRKNNNNIHDNNNNNSSANNSHNDSNDSNNLNNFNNNNKSDVAVSTNKKGDTASLYFFNDQCFMSSANLAVVSDTKFIKNALFNQSIIDKRALEKHVDDTDYKDHNNNSIKEEKEEEDEDKSSTGKSSFTSKLKSPSTIPKIKKSIIDSLYHNRRLNISFHKEQGDANTTKNRKSIHSTSHLPAQSSTKSFRQSKKYKRS